MRLAFVLVLGGACTPRAPSPPVVTAFVGMPTSLSVGVSVAINGDIAFSDADADITTAIFAMVDPKGNVRESPPAATDESGLYENHFPFQVNVTPTVVGPHRLTVRLVDATMLSSAPAELMLDVK